MTHQSTKFHKALQELSGSLDNLAKLHEEEVENLRAELVQQQGKLVDNAHWACAESAQNGDLLPGALGTEIETAQNGDVHLASTQAQPSWNTTSNAFEVADDDALFKPTVNTDNEALRKGADACDLLFDDELLGQVVEDVDSWQECKSSWISCDAGDQAAADLKALPNANERLSAASAVSVATVIEDTSKDARPDDPAAPRLHKEKSKSATLGSAEIEMITITSDNDDNGNGDGRSGDEPQVRKVRSSKANWLSKRSTSSKFHQFYIRQRWLDVDQDFVNIPLIDIISQERRGEMALKKHKSLSRTQTFLNEVGGLNASWCVIHPQSMTRSFWVLTCVALLMYDFVIVPFDVCFQPEQTEVFDSVAMGTTIFWTVDILLNFLVGVQSYAGVERRLKRIACLYAKSWLAFDILLVLPEWLTYIFGDQFASDQVSLFRMVRWGRLMRFLRLARLMKLTRLKTLIRRLAYEVNCTKGYTVVSQGWLGVSLLVVLFLHLLSCFWYAFGNAFDNGWVHKNGLTATDAKRAYVISFHWSLCRLQGLTSDYRLETTWEMIADAVLVFCSLVLAAFYFSRVIAVAMTGVQDKSTNLWKISIEVAHRHRLPSEMSFRLEKALEAAHRSNVSDFAREEAMLLEALPSTLQHDLIFEARRPILINNCFFHDLVSFNRRTVRHICNGAITWLILFEDELVFAFADACSRVLFIDSGECRYTSGRGHSGDDEDNENQILAQGACISEPVLWTSWEHKGALVVSEGSATLSLAAQEFGEVISQHKGPCMHAGRYAKNFVWNMNHCDQLDDVTAFPHLTVDKLDENLFSGSDEDHFMFISHYKVEAGTEATLIRDLLGPMLQEDLSHPANNLRSPIFIDSEDLSDLSRLKEHVVGSTALVLLLTPGVLSRPWCLIEIITALENAVSIVPVEVQRPGSSYRYPDEDFYAGIHTGKLVSQDGVDLLIREGFTLADCEKAIRQVFLKISCPFSPHKTKAIREAELHDILRRCNGELDAAGGEFVE